MHQEDKEIFGEPSWLSPIAKKIHTSQTETHIDLSEVMRL
jgi:hypothetical protein